MPSPERSLAEVWTDRWRPWMPPGAPWDDWTDAAQPTVLFWDVMRKRGNAFLEREAQGKPSVLVFEHEMVLDGRTLAEWLGVRLDETANRAGGPRISAADFRVSA